eukprot:Sdes_comp19912_c0_seq2m12330
MAELSSGMHRLTIEYFHAQGKLMEKIRSAAFLKVRPSEIQSGLTDSPTFCAQISYYCPGSYWPLGGGGVSKQPLPRNRLFVPVRSRARYSEKHSMDAFTQDEKQPLEWLDQNQAKDDHHFASPSHQPENKSQAMNFQSIEAEETKNSLTMLQSELEVVKEMYFVSTALAIKLSKTPQKLCHSCTKGTPRFDPWNTTSIQDLYALAKSQNISLQEWPQYILKNLNPHSS